MFEQPSWDMPPPLRIRDCLSAWTLQSAAHFKVRGSFELTSRTWLTRQLKACSEGRHCPSVVRAAFPHTCLHALTLHRLPPLAPRATRGDGPPHPMRPRTQNWMGGQRKRVRVGSEARGVPAAPIAMRRSMQLLASTPVVASARSGPLGLPPSDHAILRNTPLGVFMAVPAQRVPRPQPPLAAAPPASHQHLYPPKLQQQHVYFHQPEYTPAPAPDSAQAAARQTPGRLSWGGMYTPQGGPLPEPPSGPDRGGSAAVPDSASVGSPPLRVGYTSDDGCSNVDAGIEPEASLGAGSEAGGASRVWGALVTPSPQLSGGGQPGPAVPPAAPRPDCTLEPDVPHPGAGGAGPRAGRWGALDGGGGGCVGGAGSGAGVGAGLRPWGNVGCAYTLSAGRSYATSVPSVLGSGHSRSMAAGRAGVCKRPCRLRWVLCQRVARPPPPLRCTQCYRLRPLHPLTHACTHTHTVGLPVPPTVPAVPD
jgi:hypothetical protein